MHTILHRLANGGVGNYPPNPKVMAIMTGDGFGWSQEKQDWEASKFTIAAPATGWNGFTLTFATEWVQALANGGLTEAQALDLFARRIQLRRGYASYATVEERDLPSHIVSDRYFRNAVTWDDSAANKSRLDMPKARVIHMDRIRQKRDKELTRLDITFMRAVEDGDTVEQQRVAAEKQALRDLPQTFDLNVFSTPEALKAAWPPQLPSQVI